MNAKQRIAAAIRVAKFLDRAEVLEESATKLARKIVLSAGRDRTSGPPNLSPVLLRLHAVFIKQGKMHAVCKVCEEDENKLRERRTKKK